MRRLTLISLLVLTWLVPTLAEPVGLPAEAGRNEPGPIVRAQAALDWLGLSPGIIDGKTGPRTASAVMRVQQLAGLPITGQLDPDTQRLLDALAKPPVIRYAVRPEDLRGLTAIPKNWLERSRLPGMEHTTVLERLAERSHVSEVLLQALNPEVNWQALKPGQVVTLFDFSDCPAAPAERVEISLGARTVTLFGRDNRQLAVFYCSIGADPAKRPVGTYKVTSILSRPPYAFDPKLYPESGLEQKLTIPPGPNNPVGTVWIGISKPGFGLHGTPDPEDVGRTGSHGCFRLTNWDAERVARMVRLGTPVAVKP